MMIPKDKAKELTDKFAKIEPYLPSKDKVLFMYEAKQCALICVDEVLKVLSIDSTEFENYRDINLIDSKYDYWEEVKQHINEL